MARSKQWRQSRHKKNRLKLVFLVGLVVIASIFYLMIQSHPDNPNLFIYILSNRISTLTAMIIASFAIGSSTVVFQAIIHNPIVTPNLLGMNAMYLLVHTATVFTAGAGSLVATNANLAFLIDLAVMSIASVYLYAYIFKKIGNHILYILLIGTILSSLFTSIQSAMVRVMDPDEYDALLTSLVADFNQVNVEIIFLSLIILVGLTIFLWNDLKRLNIIALGKDYAINLGLDYYRTIRRLLLGVVLSISVATAMVGPVSFLGLIVANLARQLLSTHRHGQIMIASSLLGVLVVIIGQIISQHLFTYAIPIAPLITFFGGIYFLYLLLVKRGGIQY